MGLRTLSAAEATLRGNAAKAQATNRADTNPADGKPIRPGRDRVALEPKAASSGPKAPELPGKSPELVLLASIHSVATEGLEHDSHERPPSRFGSRHPLDGGEVVIDYDFKAAIDELRGKLERISKAAGASGHERLKSIHDSACDALAKPGWDARLTEAEKLQRYREHAGTVLAIGGKSDLPQPEQVLELLDRQVSDVRKAIESVAAKREPLRQELLSARAAADAVAIWKKCLGYGLVQTWWNNRKATQLTQQLALIEGLERDAKSVQEGARGLQKGTAQAWKLADAELLAQHASAIGAQATSVAHRAFTVAAQIF